MFKSNIDEIELIIKYSKLVEKFFEKYLDIENRFLKNLEVFYIGEEKNIDIKKLKGTIIPQYRMRIGSYRVIFTVNKESIKVYSIYVEKTGSRGEIYKN
ncbi:addiction module toxin RelE [Fusobacterium polymorphum]|uniref:type II toxin-antitoxin system RelE family toxin n=1 Tax=Fusobacterium nucleatum subsp. polymorphum TaxID=76857 RepID=UPI0030089156